MTVQEILEKVCGIDQDGDPRSLVSLYLLETNEEGDNAKEITSVSVFKPAVNIRNVSGMIMADLIFKSQSDVDLKRMYDIAEKYGDLSNAFFLAENPPVIPHLMLYLFPVENQGGFLQCGNPFMWSLTSTGVNTGLNCLRIIFDPDNIAITESDPLDVSEALAEADIEMNEREQIEKMRQEKLARKEDDEKRLISLMQQKNR